jgi:hypothetical protein
LLGCHLQLEVCEGVAEGVAAVPEAHFAVPSDHAFCELDMAGGKAKAPIVSIGADVVVVQIEAQLKHNDYIDVALHLQDGGKHNLFTQVVGAGDGQARLRWLHFDPSEQARLGRILQKWADKLGLESGEAPATTTIQRSAASARSRRVVKPRRGAVMPQADASSSASEPSARTRKLVRPEPDASPVAAMAAAAGDESPQGKHKVRKGMVQPKSLEQLEAEKAQKVEVEEAEKAAHAKAITESQAVTEPKAVSKPIVEEVVSTTAPTDELELDDVPTAAAPSDEVSQASTKSVVLAPQPEASEEPPASASARKATQGSAAPVAKDTKETDPDEIESVSTSKSGRRRTVRKTRVSVRGEDGTLDVAASIRAQTRTMSSEELAKKQDKVRVLNMRVIRDLIAQSVADAIGRLGADLEEAEKKRLLAEAEEEFQEKMKDFQAEKMGLEERAQQLQSQLDRAENLLKKEKGREVDANQFTMSAASIEDLEKTLKRLIDVAQRDGLSGAVADDINALVANSLNSERQKRADQEEVAKNQSIALLEKKVKRLAASLEDAERDRDHSQRKVAYLEASGGGAIAGQKVFGMEDEDPDRERKLDLLKGIFRENQEMRQAIAGTGIKIQGRKRPKKAAPAPAAAAAEGAEGAEGAEAPAGDSETVSAETETPSASDEALAASAVPAEAEAAAASDVDPDDLPWEPGQSFSKEPDLGDEGDSPIKKMTDFKQFAPPPLQSAAATEATNEAPPAEEPGAEDIDPDDMPWEPGQSFSREPELDDEDASPVKKITSFKSFEPPPLQR